MASTSRQFNLTILAPPATGLPAWINSMQPWEWKKIPTANTMAAVYPSSPYGALPATSYPQGTTGPGAVVGAWGCVAVTIDGDVYFWGGGHGDYPGNEVYRLKLNAASPAYERLTNPSPPPYPYDVEYYPTDGLPSARHSLNALWVSNGKLFAVGARGTYGSGGGVSTKLDVFNIATRTWQCNASPTFAALGKSTNHACGDLTTGELFAACASGACPVVSINPTATNYPTTVLANENGNRGLYFASVFDSLRRRVWLIGNPDGVPPNTPSAGYVQLSNNSLVYPVLTGSAAGQFGTSASAQGQSYNPGLAYDVANDMILYKTRAGNAVYRIKCSDNTCEPVTVSGQVPPDCWSQVEADGRFRYIPQLKGCIYVPVPDQAYFLRTSA